MSDAGRKPTDAERTGDTLVARADRAARERARPPADRRTGLHALKLAQERQNVRLGTPVAVRAAMAASGLLPRSEGLSEAAPSPDAGTVSWYAVQTVPGSERQARDELLRLGHLARVPMRAEWRPTRKRELWRKRGKVRVERPICGGYAFLGVRGAVDWRAVRRCDGVVSVLGAGGSPDPVRQVGALFALFVADETGAFDRTVSARPGMRGPSAFRIVEGPYAGFIARIMGCKGDAARVVIAGLFGRGVRDVPKAVLEAV